jgi:murein DD-endopeptidase MepM/ murein hydrolase activator NlpD
MSKQVHPHRVINAAQGRVRSSPHSADQFHNHCRDHPSSHSGDQRHSYEVDPIPPRVHSQRRPQAPTERRPQTSRKDYTLGHAGRLVRVGPAVFWTALGALVIVVGWSIVTAAYFAFHDDVLARLIAHEAAMQIAYEDRIAEMRMQIDRATSRQLLDQEQFEQKLQLLLRRQAVLESRAATLGGVADPTVTGSIKPSVRTNPTKSPAVNGASSVTTPAERETRLELRPFPGNVAPTPNGGGRNIETILAGVQDSLNRIETRQTGSLNAIEEGYDARARRLRAVFADLGLDLAHAGTQGGVGGPFVPLKEHGDGKGFETQVYRINLARAQVDRLNRILATVPIRAPVIGEIDATSGFGVRVDPFLARPAMHTGVDFRGVIGDPIRVTAGGAVTHAGWSGGYGEMVEVDHGNGLSTRYGHLSKIEVSVGQVVKAGQVIGRLGSSGRSTGPHLHYETRVMGEAVDPERFLRAGLRVGDAL